MILFVEEFKEIPNGRCDIHLNDEKQPRQGLWYKCPETGNMKVACEDHEEVIPGTLVRVILDDKQVSWYHGEINPDHTLRTFPPA